MLGLKPEAAARFSFLLSIPVIFLAGSLETVEYLQAASIEDAWPLLIGALISAISAYACIHYFLKLLDRIGMMPFVAYRLVLGLILLVLFI
jgi:undecaprenyl-diphosphatase